MNGSIVFDRAARRARSIDWARQRVTVAYWWRHRRRPNLDGPLRFTELVQQRKLSDRRLSLAMLTDKLHAKQLASSRIGPESVVPTLWEGDHLPSCPPWPYPFVVKANHGCNQFAVVRDPDDYRAARRQAPTWLRRPYGQMLDEWHYRAARRMLLIEPFLGGSAAELPLDYKVYVFGGRAEIVQVHVDRARNHRWTQFDRSWRPLSLEPIQAPPPPCLRSLLAAAEALAGGEDFLRVDFYCIEDRVLFGEFCLFPGSGLDPFRPDQLDHRLGEAWISAAERGRANY